MTVSAFVICRGTRGRLLQQPGICHSTTVGKLYDHYY